MARSFYRATPGETVKDFYHQPSDTHFSLSVHEGKYVQRRWQIGFGGKEINAEELTMNYVLGSGNHARAYLSRTARGTLIQLPLGWYSEKGGYWAMNPGYDTTHPPSHRPINYECMFCHNAYPQVPAKNETPGSEPVYVGNLPEGIDCQRCHGSGAKHIQLARGAAKPEQIRAAIVNPARLSKERQMDVCMQCHLEPASTRLPSMVRIPGRAPFSYVAGQPLTKFIAFFEHTPGSEWNDRFEIAGGAYRLRKSQCFLKSKGELTCQTCHNPHDIPRGAEAAAHYASVCRQCHASAVDRLTASGSHPTNSDCVSCHMPKRRTSDAVHVVMTDHLIQRRLPPGDLLADLRESHPSPKDEYHGEVAPYYPKSSPSGALLHGLAQALQGSKRPIGVDRQTAYGTRSAFETALQSDPYNEIATSAFARFLAAGGEREEALFYFDKAARLQPADAVNLYEFALTLVQMNRFEESRIQVEAAVKADRNLAEAHELFGGLLAREKDLDPAITEYREAVRLKPEFSRAQLDLAAALALQGDVHSAIPHFREASKSTDPRIAAAARQALVRLAGAQ